ncbi:MAG: polymer-forming cytoskeletal protein [Lachnospira sp.]|nr:polymer-forming cytoskeletal protein [Lachnospira sp.]
MSLFKDFKDDVSQAANELMEELDSTSKETDVADEGMDLDAEMQALFGEDEALLKDSPAEDAVMDMDAEEAKIDMDATLGELVGGETLADAALEMNNQEVQEALEETVASEEAAPAEQTISMEEDTMSKEEVMETVDTQMNAAPSIEADFGDTPADEETATITKGTEIAGNIKTTGSLDVLGSIEGDIACKGKLVISGAVKGKSEASEIFTDSANVTGDMVSTGSIKIGVGSVIVGNLNASSAVIAGAVKGDIDVNGPVIIDSTAVIMGNVKSRSVQVNNGAIMEGLCSQSYSDVDVNTFFEN